MSPAAPDRTNTAQRKRSMCLRLPPEREVTHHERGLPPSPTHGYISPSAAPLVSPWRDGREAEGTGLLNRHRGSPSIEGSNPSPSASKARRSRGGPSCFTLLC